MKIRFPKTYQFTIIGLLLAFSISFQAVQAQTPKETAEQDIKLEFKIHEGSNGSGLAWNSKAKVYYAVIAGNADFPIETFKEDGSHQHSREAGFDTRGIWWNKKKKRLEGNQPFEKGWFGITTDKKTGKLNNGASTLVEGQHQPCGQCAGTFDSKKKLVIFYNEGKITSYSPKDYSKVSTLKLKFKSTGTYKVAEYVLGYTGVKGYEFALLDYKKVKIFYFDREGNETGYTQIPGVKSVKDVFNFAVSNKKAFLWDKEERTWWGFNIFE